MVDTKNDDGSTVRWNWKASDSLVAITAGDAMRKYFRLGILGLAALGSGVLHNTVRAQQADSSSASVGGLDEIVVTARKSRESLLDVPVAVSVVSQSTLKDNDATDLTKIGELVPQVLIGQATTGTGALLTIRGVSSSPLDSGIDQSVSVDVDGVQMSRGRIIQASFFDIQQVQVLQGPQALFFGKNSPAGVISVQSVNPTDHLEGYVRGGYEFKADERFGEAAIGGPITDTLKARLAVRASYMDGWIRNVVNANPDPLVPGVTIPGSNNSFPQGHSLTGRLSVLWNPVDNFDATLKVTADQQRLNSTQGTSQMFCARGVTVPTELSIPLQGTCAKDMTSAVANLPAEFAVNLPYANNGQQYLKSNATLGSLTLNERLDKVTLTSTTGYYQQSISDAGSFDDSSITQVFSTEHERYRQVTEELRATTDFATPFNFSGGLYYDNSNRPHYNAPIFLITGLNPDTNNFANNQQQAQNTGHTYSAFAQARWKIIPSLEFAAGARYTQEAKAFSIGNIAVNPTGIIPGLRPPGSNLAGSFVDHNVSPEATLTWHPVDNQTLYAAYKTGYKSGGFSNPAILYAFNTVDQLRFNHEIVKGFEIGYKAELFDRRVRLNVAAYRYNYDGLQVTSFDAATLSYSVQNAANARVQGVEGDVEWAATSALTFTGSVGYNRARFITFPGAQCYINQTPATGCVDGAQDLAGKSLVRAPNVAFDLGGRYEMNLTSTWSAGLSIDGAYSSAYQVDETQDPETIQDAFWRLNAALHIHPMSKQYEFSIIGRNLTNSYYMLTANGIPLSPDRYEAGFARPREVLLQAEVNF
jgi:iron complex outermembrane recepter protein